MSGYMYPESVVVATAADAPTVATAGAAWAPTDDAGSRREWDIVDTPLQDHPLTGISQLLE